MSESSTLQERVKVLETILGISDIYSVNTNGSSTCPACGKKNKFSVRDNKTARCWSTHCTLNSNKDGQVYNIVSLYQTLNNYDSSGKGYYQALLDLEKKAGINSTINIVENDRSLFLQECLELYQWALWSAEGEKAREYLLKRGFSEDLIKKHQIGYAPNAYFLRGFDEISSLKLKEEKLLYYNKEYFDNRIIFPIKDYRGNLVHFVGRYLGEVPKDEEGEEVVPRYKDTQAVKNILGTKSYLAFEHLIPSYIQSNVSTLYIAEGYPDSLSLIQRGFCSVGLLGLEKLVSHKDKFKHFENIVAVFDNDFYPKNHSQFPLEYKSWRKIIPQLVELQKVLPNLKIFTWLVPQKEGIKDINDWLTHNQDMSQEEIRTLIDSEKKNLVLQLIKKWGDDITKHKTLLELISSTNIGKEELENYITYTSPLDYALEVFRGF